jgi:integrase
MKNLFTIGVVCTKLPKKEIYTVYLGLYNPNYKQKFGEGMGKIYLGIHIEHERWAHCLTAFGPWIKGDDELTMLQNENIRESMKKVELLYHKLKSVLKIEPRCRDIMDAWKNGIKEPVRRSFFELIQEYKTAMKLAPATGDIYRAMEIALRAFLSKTNQQDLFCDEMETALVYRFELYLQKSFGPKGRMYNASSIIEYMNKFKAVINWATKLGEIKTNILQGYSAITEKEEDRSAEIMWKISPEDLHKIETVSIAARSIEVGKEELHAKDTTGGDLSRARLLFLLQTWTGMAFADLEKYGKNIRNYITKDLANRDSLVYNRVKTGELAPVPIFPQTLEILTVLNYDCSPQVSYDTYKRKISGLLHFYRIKHNEDMSSRSHLGRHLFGTRMLSLGFSMESVSRMMGHTSITETEKVYARVDQHKIFSDLDRIMIASQEQSKIAV